MKERNGEPQPFRMRACGQSRGNRMRYFSSGLMAGVLSVAGLYAQTTTAGGSNPAPSGNPPVIKAETRVVPITTDGAPSRVGDAVPAGVPVTGL